MTSKVTPEDFVITKEMFDEFVREQDGKLRMILNEKFANEYVKIIDERNEAIKLLKKLEWCYIQDYHWHLCPVCKGDRDGKGHADDCEYVAVMG